MFVAGSGGAFIMNGGEISGNKTQASGGGVSVSTNGIFTYNNGTISGNALTTSVASPSGQVAKSDSGTVNGSDNIPSPTSGFNGFLYWDTWD